MASGRLFIVGAVSLFCVGTLVYIFGRHGSPAGTSSNYPTKESLDDAVDITKLRNLIVVPGHAIHRCRSWQELQQDDCWTLLPYQKGQVGSFLTHLRVAMELAAGDPQAMLMLSGGQTRLHAGPRSESSAYLAASELASWFGQRSSVSRRTVTEDYARDSLQNILFSLCRFHQITGQWPTRISVVGFPFKAKRFAELHWPVCSSGLEEGEEIAFDYVGEGDSQGVDDAYPLFAQDPTGCSPELIEKRVHRNPFRQSHPYQTCPHPLVDAGTANNCHVVV